MNKHTLTFHAPAKINLYLHVVGRRTDGYHLLDSLVAFTPAAHDTLTFTPSDALSLTLHHVDATIPIEQNLVMKAARALQHHSHVTFGAAIHLE
jgi:4-diphosphocytidyl-2-C-methyl-D-erythritol kinase